MVGFQKRLLFSLAYVPATKVEDYARVVSTLITDPEMAELKKTFFQTWIGSSSRNVAPMFRLEWWNLYDRIGNGDATTNNYSEADNRRLAKLMGIKRPGVWKFMLHLHSTYGYYEKKYSEFLGPRPARKKSTYEEKRARAISDAVGKIDELTAKEYLKAVAKATSF